MSIHVRPMEARDHAVVGPLTVAAYEAADAYVSNDYREHLLDAAGRQDHGLVLVAVDEEDRVLGSVVSTEPGDPAWEGRQPAHGDAGFRMLAVDPDAQGAGAGTALVDACVERARERGRRRMIITTMPTMTTAHGMYERRGFVRRPDLDVMFHAGRGMVLHLDLAQDAADHFPTPGPVPDTPPWFEDVWAPDTGDASHC